MLLKRLHNAIFGPMPLDEFEDYNDYWGKRKLPVELNTSAKKDQHVLHRFVSIAKQIPKGSSVIDIGCGDGAFLKYLENQKKNLSLYGMDISSNAIERLNQHGIEGSPIKLGVPLREIINRDFDYVTMMEVIEHVHEAEELVKFTLAFRPKGIFITIPNAGFIMHRLRLMFGGRFPITFILLHMKEHIRFWTVKDFYQWADHLDLVVENLRVKKRGPAIRYACF